MSEATRLNILERAQDDLKKIGEQLQSSDQEHHYSALALLFMVRESVLEVLESLSEQQLGGKSHKPSSPSQVYSACWNDITTFSYMVTDLLIHESSQCAFDVASRYGSIVGDLLGHFRAPKKNKKLSIKARPLTGDSFAIVEQLLNDEIMRGDLPGLKKELEMIQTALKKGEDNTHSVRVRVAIDIVRIREILHTFFGEIHTENEAFDDDDLRIICEMNTQIGEDEDHLGLVVSSVISEGTCPEAVSLVSRYIDLSERLAAYFEEYDMGVFQTPMIPVISVSELIQEEGDFDPSAN